MVVGIANRLIRHTMSVRGSPLARFSARAALFTRTASVNSLRM